MSKVSIIGACSPSMFVNQENCAPLGLEVAPNDLRFDVQKWRGKSVGSFQQKQPPR